LECARATWGVDTLVFGTDVPHVPNAEKDTVAALQARSWSDAELDGIFGGTVRRLLA
jgi:predicted TIM-barrel fold metal-dependent hydrolase